MIVAIGLSVFIATIISILWVRCIDSDIGDYEYCIGCTDSECNDEPKSDGCGKWRKNGK